MSFVASLGIICVDLIYGGMPCIPALGEEVYAKSFDIKFGGGPPATLINLSKLGVPVRLGTFVGKGVFSEFARGILEESGITYRNYSAGEDILNITSVMSLEKDRSFASFFYGGEQACISEAEVYELFRGCKIAYAILGYDDVFKRLKREGAFILMDSAWQENLGLELYEKAFEYVDCFTPNEKEAYEITGKSDPGDALRMLARHVPYPVVKLGEKGCMVGDTQHTEHIRAHDGVHCDSTGAGDAFVSGMLYGLYHGRSVRQAAIYGNIMGAACIARTGCLIDGMDEGRLLTLARKQERP